MSTTLKNVIIDFDLNNAASQDSSMPTITLKNVTIVLDGKTFFAEEVKEVVPEPRESIYISLYRQHGPDDADKLIARSKALTAFQQTLYRCFGALPYMSSGVKACGSDETEWWFLIPDATSGHKHWVKAARECGLILDYTIR
jgi:hypothetical protein